jgi:hypothetical protein
MKAECLKRNNELRNLLDDRIKVRQIPDIVIFVPIEMVKRELCGLDASAGRRNALERAHVSAVDLEVQRQVVSVDGHVLDVPVPVGEGVDEGLKLGRHLGGRPGLVVDVDGGGVEGLHGLEVVGVAVVDVSLVDGATLVVIGRDIASQGGDRGGSHRLSRHGGGRWDARRPNPG